MYTLFLTLHSLLRWVVLAAGIVAVVRGIAGLAGRKGWTPADEGMGRTFAVSLDVQALLGFLLYFFLSPVTTAAFGDFGAAMRTGIMRYWTVEHLTLMIVALALAHIGRARIRKAVEPRAKHRAVAIFFGIALVALLVGIPWPFSTYARPLFRFF